MDSYWISQAQEYAKVFKAFRNELPNDIDSNEVLSLWFHFRESICDCDGCREDADCVIHIDVPDYEGE
jgi:hypothetical protein